MVVAAGNGIALGGSAALEAWKSSRGNGGTKTREASQRQSIMRLASMFPTAVEGV